MTVQTSKEVVVNAGEQYFTKNRRETIKATRVATSIVVTVFDPDTGLGGVAHMALPDSNMAPHVGDSDLKYVDKALPVFINALMEKGLLKSQAEVKVAGGSQLFNFGGGGNVLNVGTRNTITVRTILTREGLTVDKTDTGGNKLRTVALDMASGHVLIVHPGEAPRQL